MKITRLLAGVVIALVSLHAPESSAGLQQRATCPMAGTVLKGGICVHPTKPSIKHMAQCPPGYLLRSSDGTCYNNQKPPPPRSTTSAATQIVGKASCPFPNMYINGRDCMFKNNPSAGYPAKCPPGTALLIGGQCLKSTPPSTTSRKG
jgi:hypothetical protein